MDTIHWIENGAILKALIYVFLSVIACVLGAWAGLITARQMFLR
jgi:fluoride ion exporter CrcB/FEX